MGNTNTTPKMLPAEHCEDPTDVRVILYGIDTLVRKDKGFTEPFTDAEKVVISDELEWAHKQVDEFVKVFNNNEREKVVEMVLAIDERDTRNITVLQWIHTALKSFFTNNVKRQRERSEITKTLAALLKDD